MNRDQMIQWLTANCSYWQDEEGQETLLTLTDNKLEQLVTNASRVRQTAAVASSAGASTLVLGGGNGRRSGFSWWQPMASALPLIALVAGLVAINIIQDDDRTSELAEVDAALLTDDLPPDAYADPGFVQFLKTSHSRETH